MLPVAPLHYRSEPRLPHRDNSKADKTEVTFLKSDLDHLYMVVEALWSFVQERGGLTEEDLIKRVAEIDIRDGRLDGRTTKTAIKECNQCRRPVSVRAQTCPYCGTVSVRRPFDR